LVGFATWYEFGLTDVGDINIVNDAGTTRLGIGTATNSSYRVNIDGAVRIDGNLVVTGTGAVAASKYNTREYNGDGTTLTFAITTYAGGIQHTANSVLVFLNGVAQVGGTDFTVDGTGANVVFASGSAPLSTDDVHIVEMPI